MLRRRRRQRCWRRPVLRDLLLNHHRERVSQCLRCAANRGAQERMPFGLVCPGHRRVKLVAEKTDRGAGPLERILTWF